MLFHSLQGAGVGFAASQEATFTVTGSWVVPDSVTSISAVCVGAGGGGSQTTGGGSGGGGGDLRYYNNLSVTPGETLTITVGTGGAAGITTGTAGGFSRIARGATVLLEAAGGGGGSTTGSGTKNGTSTTVGGSIGGGNGGTCADPQTVQAGGGGGAAGYSGNGGNAGVGDGVDGSAGAGGGGGGGGGGSSSSYGGPGGGVGAFGTGPNGAGGDGVTGAYGESATGGSYGDGGLNFNSVGATTIGNVSNDFGAGGNGADDGSSGGIGGNGFARIVWPGNTRSFPTTNVWMSRILTTVIETQSSTSTITIPASAVAGDLAVLSSMSETSGTQSDPSGWTRIVNQEASSPVLTCWYRIIQSGDAGTTVTMTSGSVSSSEMILFRKSSGVISLATVTGATIERDTGGVATQTQPVTGANAQTSIVFGVFAATSFEIVSGDMEFEGGLAGGTTNVEPSAVFTGGNGDTTRQMFIRFRIYDTPPPLSVRVDNTRDVDIQTMASFVIGVR